MKKKLKDSLVKYRAKRYHDNHNKTAFQALRNIEKDTKYKLRKNMKNKIDSYAKEVLGSKDFAPWLYVYTAYNQEFKEGWIPDNYFGHIVAPKVNKGIGDISNIKTLSKKITQTDLLPDKFYLIDKALYDMDYNFIEEDQIETALFSQSNAYFLKTDSSNQGKGVLRITKDNFDINEFYGYGDAVLQEPIIQSEWYDEIVPGSVATLRITTIKDNENNIKLAGSFIRFGRKDSEIVQASSLIRVPVINSYGEMGEFGSDPHWYRHYNHPDTNVRFSGKYLPQFDQAVESCIKIHKSLPYFNIIGWDVGVSNDNKIKIMEWNARLPDVKFIESTTGPAFKHLGWENLNNK